MNQIKFCELTPEFILSFVIKTLKDEFGIQDLDKIITLQQNGLLDKHGNPKPENKISDDKDFSIIINKTVAFKIYQSKYNVFNICIKNDYVILVDKLSFRDLKSLKNWSKSIIYDLNDLNNLKKAICAVFDDLTDKDIGCCSKYIECSDNLKCIQTIPDLFLHCYYRKNLSMGKIFYGKNKTN